MKMLAFKLDVVEQLNVLFIYWVVKHQVFTLLTV